MEALWMVQTVREFYVYASLDILRDLRKCVDTLAHRVLPADTEDSLPGRFVSRQCSVLVVFRVPKQVRAKLVLRRSGIVFTRDLCGSCHGCVFYRSARGDEHCRAVAIVSHAQTHALSTTAGSRQPQDARGSRPGPRLVRACRGGSLAGLLVPLALGIPSADFGLAPGAAQRRERPAEVGARRVERSDPAGAGGLGVWFFMGDVEPLQLPKMGLLHSLCPTIRNFRNAFAGLSRLSAFRSAMWCGRRPGRTTGGHTGGVARCSVIAARVEFRRYQRLSAYDARRL